MKSGIAFVIIAFGIGMACGADLQRRHDSVAYDKLAALASEAATSLLRDAKLLREDTADLHACHEALKGNRL